MTAAAAPPAVDATQLAAAPLQDMLGSTSQAGALWASAPCVVLVLRRPGCVLCRAEAQKLWAMEPELQRMGVNLACLLHEALPKEVASFAPAYWPGPLYLDTTKAFYRALGGGEVLQASLTSMLNPFGAVWRRIMEARKVVAEHNVIGDGLTLGGLMVLAPGQKSPVFVHVESEMGLHADHGDVLAAAQRAAGVPVTASCGIKAPRPVLECSSACRLVA